MKPRLTLEPYCGTGPLWWHCRSEGVTCVAKDAATAYAMWVDHMRRKLEPVTPRRANGFWRRLIGC